MGCVPRGERGLLGDDELTARTHFPVDSAARPRHIQIMRMLRHTALLSLVALVLGTPAGLAAQTRLTNPTLTDQQKRGEALFLQRCPLCHVPSNEKKTQGIQASSDLVGLFQRPTANEAAVRRIVQEGLPRLMPAFRYSVTGGNLDDLIAYLRVR